MQGSPETAETLRGIINSGLILDDADTAKLIPIPGADWEPRLFSARCPQVLAGIGKLPATIADRTISIHMQRKRTTDKVRPLRRKHGADLQVLARKAARWAADHVFELGDADPEIPEFPSDRTADAWSPLLAIADAAGGDWPERARRAAIQISGQDDAETVETQLLADIRAVFETKRSTAEKAGDETAIKLADRISSQDLVAYLVDLEDRPWAEVQRGRPLTKNGLASRLKPFSISPGTIRLGEGRGAPTAKGYYRRQFEDAFSRYLSPLPPKNDDSPVTPSHAAENKGLQADSDTSHQEACDVSEIAENPSNSAVCDGVTGKTAENRGVCGESTQ